MSKATRLFNKNFTLLWQGQLISQLGTQAYMIALMFYIKHSTGSASLVGLMMMTSHIPAVILGPLAGTFADSHSRKKIIVICDLINGVVIFVLFLMVFYLESNSDIIIPALFVVALITSTVGSFFRPAISASIPDIVPADKLAAANSMNHTTLQLATFIGQGAGGVLYRVLGAPMLFLIDAVSFIFSAVSEMFITIPQNHNPSKLKGKALISKFWGETKDGFKYVNKNVGVKFLFGATAFLNFFIIPIIVLLPFYVEDTLKSTSDWFGYILSALGLGSMFGFLLAGTLKLKGKSRSYLMMLSLIVAAVALTFLGLTKSAVTAVILMFIAGLFIGFFNINVTTLLQITTPSEMRGRIFGLLGTFASGLAPISMGLTGVVTDMLDQNIPLIFIWCGGITVALSVLITFFKSFRDYLAFEPAPETT